MLRTVISLDPEDKKWLVQKAKETNRPVTALVRQAIRRMRLEDEAKLPYADMLLELTLGMWKGEDGLANPQAVRSQW